MPILSNWPAAVAVAGGVLIAYAAYRRSMGRRSMKLRTDDLRAELRAERESLRAMMEALPAQIDLARKSRTPAAVAPADVDGLRQWLRESDLDLSEVELLTSQLPTVDAEDLSLSDVDAEIKLVEVLALSLRAGALVEKYRASTPMREAERDPFADDAFADGAEALLRETSQYSANGSRPSIAESVV